MTSLIRKLLRILGEKLQTPHRFGTSTSTHRMKTTACLVAILLIYNFTPACGKVLKDKTSRTKRQCIGIVCCITGGTGSAADCGTGAAAPSAATIYNDHPYDFKCDALSSDTGQYRELKRQSWKADHCYIAGSLTIVS
ncbi:unnamed protein product [Cylicocyclus nassatus]|uniref:Uncharacterized protein n=1 Tax=Cylicocyclus nassatus TaxID=53992 RepID=A0AA36MBK4_CYLNA|nr:unnamed protein product [Cylicocyclus nassatus]